MWSTAHVFLLFQSKILSFHLQRKDCNTFTWGLKTGQFIEQVGHLNSMCAMRLVSYFANTCSKLASYGGTEKSIELAQMQTVATGSLSVSALLNHVEET